MEYLKELVDVEDVKKLASIYDFDDKDDDDLDEEEYVWGENREDCDTRGIEWLMEESVRDDCDYLYQHTNSPYKAQSRW